ncbi:MAG: biotin/lipoyl-containing protein, partial [Bacteroidota bacterium]
MAIAVEMPKMSDTMEEGVLVAWLAEEGDSVSAGDVIAQVETDKATMDLEVYDDGVLLKKVVDEGSGVPIGGLIAVLGSAGESIDDILAQHGGGDGVATEAAPEPAASPEAAPVSEVVAPGGDGAPTSASGGRVKASPLARKMAEEGGIDIAALSG